MNKPEKMHCYYPYVKNDSPFAPLKDIFGDGIPVFDVIKERFENLEGCYYSWCISLDELTDIQKIKTLEFFSFFTNYSIEELTKYPLTIPDEVASMVLDSNLEEVNVRWAFLQQRTAHYLSTQDYRVTIVFSAQILHLVRIAFCSLVSHELLPEDMLKQLQPLLDGIDERITKECPDLKVLYDCFSSPDITKAIDNLK